MEPRRSNSVSGRIRWLAVIGGILLDYVLSILIRSIGATFDPGLMLGNSFATAPATITMILLVISTGVGGWLAGRIAKTEYVLHGTLVGGFGLIQLLIASLFGNAAPLITIVLQCIAVVVGAFGGWLSQWIPTRQKQ